MIPLQITCRGFSCTEAISKVVRDHVDQLEKFYQRILRCEVTLSQQHRHHHQGKFFHVHIQIQLSQRNIVINHEPERDHSHEDFPIALRDAFRAARRKLEDEIRIRRGFVKQSAGNNFRNVDTNDEQNITTWT